MIWLRKLPITKQSAQCPCVRAAERKLKLTETKCGDDVPDRADDLVHHFEDALREAFGIADLAVILTIVLPSSHIALASFEGLDLVGRSLDGLGDGGKARVDLVVSGGAVRIGSDGLVCEGLAYVQKRYTKKGQRTDGTGLGHDGIVEGADDGCGLLELALVEGDVGGRLDLG